MLFTVFGSRGFIGTHMTNMLRQLGHTVQTPERNTPTDHTLGHVIYAIGLTGNYRQRPFDTIDAHVSQAARILQSSAFESFTYLSSTRVYRKLPQDTSASEDIDIRMDSGFDAIYDYSKLYGEALCLGTQNPSVRVARLSNIYGAGMSQGSFLGAVCSTLASGQPLVIDDHPDSSKDYLAIKDAATALYNISTRGQARIYNVASGKNTVNATLADKIKELGYTVSFSGKTISPRIFAPIDMRRYNSEFPSLSSDLCADLQSLISPN